MTHPRRFLIRMLIFLVVVGGVAAVLFPMLRHAVMANVPLNGLILAVLVLGVLLNLRQVVRLFGEVRWLKRISAHEHGSALPTPPRLLAPIAGVMGDRLRYGGGPRLSTLATRSLLDGVAARLDESRETSRYFVGLLIFLGLLGTFWGLLQTIGSVSNVINSLSLGADDMGMLFEELKAGLEKPLNGMATAFSSSLLGLAGSLVLGFLDLQSNQAQNRFFNDLEEWLSSMTQLDAAAPAAAGGGGGGGGAYLGALIEQMNDSMEDLQRVLQRAEESRRSSEGRMLELAERLAGLSDQMRNSQQLMARMAEAQMELKPVMEQMAQSAMTGGMDETTRGHIRNLDVQMGQFIQEMNNGREEMMRHVRGEVRMLARTITAIAENE